jgi:Kef-type K+ transport system membrane component KefB
VGSGQTALSLVGVLVLVGAARAGGGIARRLGLPEVVGEISVGIMVGPTVLGRVWAEPVGALFPADAAFLRDSLAWVGVLFLVTISGLEARLDLVRASGRVVLLAWAGGFSIPFVSGLAIASLLPEGFVGADVSRGTFAFFLATAMSISAIPVIARILLDLGVHSTRIGMVIISSALVSDTVGWILLGIVTGAATHADSWWGSGVAVGGTVVFVVVALVAGPRLMAAVVRSSARLRIPYGQTLLLLAVVAACGLVTEALGVHMVLGAFVGAMLLGGHRSEFPDAYGSVRRLGMAFFVPFFFAYAGMGADLGSLSGSGVPITIAVVTVAFLGKLIGGGLGARLGGVSGWEATAIGVGLSARGAMELVIAAVGLSLGILTPPTYAMLVVVAVITSVLASPLLAACLRRSGSLIEMNAPGDPQTEESIAGAMD